jgi:hypothetical protein
MADIDNNEVLDRTEAVPEKDISEELRLKLQEERIVSGRRGFDHIKTITIHDDNVRHEFYQDYDQERDDDVWIMEIYYDDPKGLRDDPDKEAIIDKENDVLFLTALNKSDIPEIVRRALQEKRVVWYDDHGERKIIEARDGEKKYKVEYHSEEWSITTYTGDSFRTSWLQEEGDSDFLDELNTHDLPESLKLELKENGQFSKEDGYKILTVSYEGISFKFYQEDTIPGLPGDPEWRMHFFYEDTPNDVTYSYVSSTDDIQFLEETFATPSRQDEIDAIRKGLE